MATRRRFSISFAKTAGPIDARQFAEFIFRFTRLYDAVLCVGDLPALQNIDVRSSASQIENAVRRDRAKITAFFTESEATIAALQYLSSQESEKLIIQGIFKESPLYMVVSAIPVALTAAAIISGGKVNMVGFNVDLRPLGEGIASLRAAMEPHAKKTAKPVRKNAAVRRTTNPAPKRAVAQPPATKTKTRTPRTRVQRREQQEIDKDRDISISSHASDVD